MESIVIHGHDLIATPKGPPYIHLTFIVKIQKHSFSGALLNMIRAF